MSDLMHWHGAPSQLADPARCCVDAFDRLATKRAQEAHREQDAAVHRESRRVCTGLVERINAYAEAARSVLTDPEQLRLLDVFADNARRAVEVAGCICPRIEVSAMGDAEPSYRPGRSPLCGVHGNGLGS